MTVKRSDDAGATFLKAVVVCKSTWQPHHFGCVSHTPQSPSVYLSNDLANHCAVRESDPDASAYSCLTTLPQTAPIDSGNQPPIRTGAYPGQREAAPMEVGLIFEHSANPKNAYGALSFARVTL